MRNRILISLLIWHAHRMRRYDSRMRIFIYRMRDYTNIACAIEIVAECVQPFVSLGELSLMHCFRLRLGRAGGSLGALLTLSVLVC